MKKLLLIFLTLPTILLAQSFLISNIPVPKTYVQNLDPYPCDEECLQSYIDNDMIFSFLAHAQTKLDNQEQDEFRTMHLSILNIGSILNNEKVKIALLLPYKQIGKYASSTTNATFSYLITKNHSFELKNYKINSQEPEEMQQALNQIMNDGFSHVIAPLTAGGAQTLIDLDPQINVFIPTVNKKNTYSESSKIFFGGIDYEAQSDLLLKEAVSPLIIFHDKSDIGTRLTKYTEQKFLENNRSVEENNSSEISAYVSLDSIYPDASLQESTAVKQIIKYPISRKTTNLEKQIKDNEDINGSSCFVNTPIVKTSMVMSQLTLYDTNVTNILSTQINYNPLLLSMTQYIDREKMVIANSITKHNNVLIQTNSLLSNDIEYDWINYATTVAVDYFFALLTNAQREYDIRLIENQLEYPIELLKPSISKFVQHTPKPPTQDSNSPYPF